MQVQRKAEVGDLRIVPGVDQDIGRLDIPMHHPLTERMVEREAAFEKDADGPVHRQQAIDRAKLVERLALDILHDDVGLIVFNDRVVDLDDVRVIETSSDRPFNLEQLAQAPRHHGVIATKADQFDRDLASAVRIARQVDDRRRAFAQYTNGFVLADLFHVATD